MGGFVIGQAVLLMAMMAPILRNFPSDRFISFEFCERKKLYPRSWPSVCSTTRRSGSKGHVLVHARDQPGHHRPAARLGHL
jgi:hypothetical protein